MSGLSCFALLGVLGLRSEALGPVWLLSVDVRLLLLMPVGRAPSKYLYNFWYTFGGHGGLGWILGRASVCLSLYTVSV